MSDRIDTDGSAVDRSIYSAWHIQANAPGAIDTASMVGEVCALAANSVQHRSQAVGGLISSLKAPILLSQIRLFHNNFGQCLGYVVWANLSPRVERRLLSDPTYVLKEFEWNEGGSLWIMDFLVATGAVKEVLAEMRDCLFASRRTVTYFRYRNGKRIVKQLSRDDLTAFFSNR